MLDLDQLRATELADLYSVYQRAWKEFARAYHATAKGEGLLARIIEDEITRLNLLQTMVLEGHKPVTP